MSAALTCTRATAPRALLRSHRFASTEAVAAGAERVMTLRPKTPAPTPAKTSTATTTAALTPKRTTAPTLAERMHRALYPEMYPNGQPVGVEKSRKPKETMSGVKSIPVFAPAPAIKKTCPAPVAAVTATSLAKLDATGARTRLFAKDNPEGARVGDILLVRQRTGDPFAGVCIDIRRRGVDTAILLRGQLTRVGVEMWYKVYSPLVEGIEVVQRAAKRARRARLTYMRTVKHDRGSVENVVRVYLRQKAALGSAEGGRKSGEAKIKAMASGGGGKKKKGRGKR